MYEAVTYEVILNRMLEKVPAGLDKREGSLIYTALAGAAAEMQIMYIEFDRILKETFADTANRENLIRRAAERGLAPKKATKAVLKAVAVPDTLEIEAGERFRCGLYNYVITAAIGKGTYQVTCETAGACGNRQFGSMTPVLSVPGLQSIELTELLIPGEDEESTESFRAAYFNSFNEKAFAGNRRDYIDRTNAIAGVGATKVIRAWNGGSTVKLVILDSGFNKASDVLIRTVQEAIDPTQDGSGTGLAPIDHMVTVDTAEEVKVLIKSHIEFDNGYSYDMLREQMKEAVERYLLELRSGWEAMGSQGSVVRISQIEARLLAIQGVADIGNTWINESASNLELTQYQIPVFGDIVID